ncbi:MAG TPA: hypothetical protein VMV07_22260 [Streptosporangiaceae bacterium]|nr:hypothetical protein [Streptosporangiaceae bacterium]
MTGQAAESLIAARRRDSTRRRQRVLSALDQMAAARQEISVSAVARTAGFSELKTIIDIDRLMAAVRTHG